MKSHPTLLSLTIIFLTTFSYGQSPSAETFINEIETLLSDLKIDSSELKYTNSWGKRKTKVRGKIDGDTKYLKLKVKYFRNGTKKESIEIYNLLFKESLIFSKQPVPLVNIIKINNEYFLVERKYYSEAAILNREIRMIDGKVLIVKKETKNSGKAFGQLISE